ncbi:indolepyruvate ferredoxin oxidoreductase family protein [Bosea sp. (in: a-proteobacteria)]|uniref:indolepyruvate ferredoxin oxidoreductase family protein n=1 Tax=Bosea sp. (in: a-proteobacteria) TaxID=1871050 RepID=UPI00260AD25D|nr:indolepyruvate ferredoxin oxidoreductase family protein [Bosea sp. (in: a-proteobacteria)]MCO5089643.1 indolepyruvate ferredoxin oxidoreductase family protein [Bosea sp. (in: a-proteobacteria)]
MAHVELDDKYTLESGRVFLTGTQALVRLPLMQRARDDAAGLNTAGFITGYRGSPLGGYDRALEEAKKHLSRSNVVFQPGLNEDLAATSVWGSQQLNLFDGATVDGVFGIWYGKGPGVDRSGDVFKHANLAGTSRYGGVIAILGDDHSCSSSSIPTQSEQSLIASMMPILSPAALQDYLDLGLLGIAMSRFTGCWVGLKAVAQTIETAGIVQVDPARLEINPPSDFVMPPGGLNIRRADPPLVQESRLHGPRMAAVAAFARANRLDRIVADSANARLGIVASGKAYLDLREALSGLGIDESKAAELGIRILKVAMVWPLESSAIMEFAKGLDEILVVEEKRSLIEDQIARILFSVEKHPRLVGKTDLDRNTLIPSDGDISPHLVSRAIRQRLAALGMLAGDVAERGRAQDEKAGALIALPPVLSRPAFFCSGCPHNTSTKLPEGSRGMAGIGCHGMVAFMPERNTPFYSHMGGEGLAWVGQAPFTIEKHVFQNLGDGTYSHSGLLAIRAAAAAGVNITYKILYNDAVAMTGGQTVEGGLSVGQITRQVAAEGAKRIVIVSEEPDRYSASDRLADGVEIHDRSEFDRIQRELRDVSGLTILIYDQTCAAEKRRRRKRGLMADPDRRVFINPAVCENCGDCSTKSNCISIQPLETELGRKRQIDQSSCNKDFSCINGFCPSFVTVKGARLRKAARARSEDPSVGLPEPAVRDSVEPYGIVVAGVGGTGVITIGALLGMAAHLEGKQVTVLDSTGMSQKNGAVTSHIRVGTGSPIYASRIPHGAADLLLGFDMVVASTATTVATYKAGRTQAIVNTAVIPPAAFVRDRDIDLGEHRMMSRLEDAIGSERTRFVPAAELARALMGDAIAANSFVLGMAAQLGLLPVGLEALTKAIRLNGAAVDQNLLALAWGRRAAVDYDSVVNAARISKAPSAPQTLDQIVEHRSALLTAYQNEAYALRYRQWVEKARRAANAVAAGDERLPTAVARNLAKLMAYKDEYEVARLYADPAFAAAMNAQFDGDFSLEFHLAPPLLAKLDPATGEPRKMKFGGWMLPLMKILARLRFLRGSIWDPFARSSDRKEERELIGNYEALLEKLIAMLSPANHDAIVDILNLPDNVRGFGPVKSRSLTTYYESVDRAVAALERNIPIPIAAE